MSEKSQVSVCVKPTINTRNVDIMALKKFIDKELSNMSMKKFMDKETQTDRNPSAMRRLYPSLPSKGEIIDISSNETETDSNSSPSISSMFYEDTQSRRDNL